MHATARRDPGGGRDDPGAELGGGWFSGVLAEAAAIAVMESAGDSDGAQAVAPLCLHAYGRAHDPDRRLSMAALLDAPAPIPLSAVVIANTMPPALLDRAREEAAPRPVIHLPDRTGELGAAGAPAAVALVDGMTGGEGVLVVARDLAGGLAALVVSRGRIR
jgi:hypothetical protein